MQKSYHLSDGQIKSLLQSDEIEFASHKLRGRSGIEAVEPNPCPLAATTFALLETQIWAFKMYRDIARARARANEWDKYFGVAGKLAYAEWNILLAFAAFKAKGSVRKFANWLIIKVDGTANFAVGREIEQIRAEIEAFHRQSMAS